MIHNIQGDSKWFKIQNKHWIPKQNLFRRWQIRKLQHYPGTAARWGYATGVWWLPDLGDWRRGGDWAGLSSATCLTTTRCVGFRGRGGDRGSIGHYSRIGSWKIRRAGHQHSIQTQSLIFKMNPLRLLQHIFSFSYMLRRTWIYPFCRWCLSWLVSYFCFSYGSSKYDI